MYLLPRLEVWGKRPVWSLLTLPEMQMIRTKTHWAQTSDSGDEWDIVMIGVASGVTFLFLVERTFLSVLALVALGSCEGLVEVFSDESGR